MAAARAAAHDLEIVERVGIAAPGERLDVIDFVPVGAAPAAPPPVAVEDRATNASPARLRKALVMTTHRSGPQCF